MKLKHFWLVLWGGIARWLIHIGVRKYLEEHEKFPKEIVWTSAWWIIGAMAAVGKTRQEMRDIAILFNDKKIKLIDVRMANGVIKWDKILQFLKEIFLDQKIENTKFPLKITAVNIKTGNLKVFESWNIAEALRATMSMPMVFSPFEVDNIVYVDGGVVSNLSIENCETKHVLAISVINEKYEVKTEAKAWFNIKKGLLGVHYSLFHKTLEFLIQQNETKSLLLAKDLHKKITLINTEHNFGPLDFQSYDEMIDFWYTEMQKIFW